MTAHPIFLLTIAPVLTTEGVTVDMKQTLVAQLACEEDNFNF
jgi:hypothetical protein